MERIILSHLFQDSEQTKKYEILKEMVCKDVIGVIFSLIVKKTKEEMSIGQRLIQQLYDSTFYLRSYDGANGRSEPRDFAYVLFDLKYLRVGDMWEIGPEKLYQ